MPQLNGVLVASKVPFVSTRFEQELGENSQRVLGIEFESLRVLAVYFPINGEKESVLRQSWGQHPGAESLGPKGSQRVVKISRAI